MQLRNLFPAPLSGYLPDADCNSAGTDSHTADSGSVTGIVTAVVGILAFVTYWLLIIHAAGRTSGPDEFLRRYEYQFDGEMKAPDDYQDLEDYLQHNFENF